LPACSEAPPASGPPWETSWTVPHRTAPWHSPPNIRRTARKKVKESTPESSSEIVLPLSAFWTPCIPDATAQVLEVKMGSHKKNHRTAMKRLKSETVL